MAAKQRRQGEPLTRMRLRDAGVGRGRPTHEQHLAIADAAAGAAVPRVQRAARGVALGATNRAGVLKTFLVFQARNSGAGSRPTC